MHLMIFYPGGVTHGAISDDASNKEIFDTLFTAATIEEGNGNGRIKRREHGNGKPEGPERFNR